MIVHWLRPKAALAARSLLLALVAAMAVGLLPTACRRSSAVPPLSAPPTATANQPPAATPAALRPITLPQDDAPHADATTEWWYENGFLDAEDGSRYAFHYVVFLVAASGFQGTVAQVAVTDFATGAYLTDQRGRIGPVAPSAEGFAFDLDGWRMAGIAGRDLLVTGAGGYALVLTTAPRKPPALHKGSGVVGYAHGAVSYYYSRTRMDVTGSLTVRGHEKRVRGAAWFDPPVGQL